MPIVGCSSYWNCLKLTTSSYPSGQEVTSYYVVMDPATRAKTKMLGKEDAEGLDVWDAAAAQRKSEGDRTPLA